MGGNGICLICHQEKLKHVPKDCGLLKALNLKLINVVPTASPPAPPPPSLTPVAASPSPGGHVTSAATPPYLLIGWEWNGPSGLTAVVAIFLEASNNFHSDDNF